MVNAENNKNSKIDVIGDLTNPDQWKNYTQRYWAFDEKLKGKNIVEASQDPKDLPEYPRWSQLRDLVLKVFRRSQVSIRRDR